MIRASNIHSLTDFTRNAKKYVEQIRETKEPVVITVNGTAQVVVQDAEVFQQMYDEYQQILKDAAERKSKGNVRHGDERVTEA